MAVEAILAQRDQGDSPIADGQPLAAPDQEQDRDAPQRIDQARRTNSAVVVSSDLEPTKPVIAIRH